MIKTKVRTYCGEEKMITALVDTGAQVNLVRRNLFDEEKLEPAKNIVDLRTIAGEKLGGGDNTMSLKVAFEVEDCCLSTRWEQCLAGEFYVADILVDMILSWSFLQGYRLAVAPHRRKLLCEYPSDDAGGG